MKTKIKHRSQTGPLKVPKEVIPGILPSYDSRFTKALKNGIVPKAAFDAAEKHRETCENSSYASKVGILDQVKLVQERDLKVAEKEIECLLQFIEELK